MTKVLSWLAILGVVLLATGLWSVFDERSETSRPRHRDARAPGTQATAEFWARPETLDDHFRRHGADFQARDAQEYARQANAHLRRAYTAGLPAKRDSEGILRVFDPRTRASGAYNADGTTRTFFKPDSPAYFDRQPGERVNLSQPLRL